MLREKELTTYKLHLHWDILRQLYQAFLHNGVSYVILVIDFYPTGFCMFYCFDVFNNFTSLAVYYFIHNVHLYTLSGSHLTSTIILVL